MGGGASWGKRRTGKRESPFAHHLLAQTLEPPPQAGRARGEQRSGSGSRVRGEGKSRGGS